MDKNEKYINDYLFFQEGPGVRNYQYTTSGVKLLNVSNLVDGNLDLSNSNRYISNEEAYGKYKHFLCDVGDLIIASSGIKADYFDKKMGFVKEEMLPLCMNTSTIRFKPLNESDMNIKYFMYYLKSGHFRKQLEYNLTGSAQLNFGPSHLKKMKFIYHDILKQKEIVGKLDSISNMIKLKKEQLLKLDVLIKSQFVEMCGTIKNNKYNYEIKKISEVFELIKDGTHSTPTYTDDKINGIKFLSAKDVTTGKINWSDIKYIPRELHEVLSKRVKPQKGDILLCKNGTTGICAKVDVDEIFDIYVSLALLRPNPGYNIDYLVESINSFETKKQFNSSLKGIGVPNLHLGEISKAKILVPPIELQNKFAQIVEQIDKQKFEFEKSLKKLEELQASLMQEYFG